MNKFDQDSKLSKRRMRAMTMFSLFLLCITLIVLNGPAWSFEFDKPSSVVDTDDKIPLITSSPDSVLADDSCLPLLKTVRYTSPSSAMDRSRHSAGKATALGLVLGVRFALGPKEVMKTDRSGKVIKFDVWQPRDKETNGAHNAHALAMSDYRRCKSDQALKALSDWRWQR